MMRPLDPIARRPALTGFTLIEVLISLTILTFGLLGVAAMQLHAMRDGSAGRHSTDGGRIARDQMELVQTLPFATVGSAAGLGWAPPPWINVPGFPAGQIPIQLQVAPGAGAGAGVEHTYNVAWNVTAVPADPNLMNVDLEVSWAETSRPNAKPTRTGLPTVTLSSVRYNW